MRKGEVRRQSIIEASERLFSAKGYLETTVDDILAELQCSKGIERELGKALEGAYPVVQPRALHRR